MFGSLKNLLSSDYQNKKEHLIYLSTPSINYIFEVFSTYTISKETYYLQTSFENDKKYNSFLNILKSRSNYNYNVDLGSSDCILTLSTCSGLNNRTVVHAKLIKKSS